MGCSNGSGVLATFCQRAIRGHHHCVDISRTIVSICGASCGSHSMSHSGIRLLGNHHLLDRGRDSALTIGIIKNPGLSLCLSVIGGNSTLLDASGLSCCRFHVRSPIGLSGHVRCIIDFHPQIDLVCTLFVKGLCVSCRQLSFAHTRFNLSVTGQIGTIRTVLRGGPINLQFHPRRIACLIACGRRKTGACLGCVQGIVHFGYS